MKKYIPLLLSLLVLAGCASPSGQENGYRQVSMDEAISVMEDESGYIILDVRTPEEFQDGHIPGAINVANESIGSAEIPKPPGSRKASRSGICQYYGVWRHSGLAGRSCNRIKREDL